jgi:hypothetical protein
LSALRGTRLRVLLSAGEDKDERAYRTVRDGVKWNCG